MANRLTRKTVALGDGGPERAAPGANYGDRRAMQARPMDSVPAPAATNAHERKRAHGRIRASNSARNFSM